jgi:glutaredoxin
MTMAARRWCYVVLILLGACGGGEAADRALEPVGSVAPEPVTVKGDNAEVVYRYLDAESQKVETSATLEGVPSEARSQVILFDTSAPAPPGWEHVVDLSGGYPATSQPQAGFQFQPKVAMPVPVSSVPDRAAGDTPAAQRPGGAHEVIMFSTQGCGFCRKAAKYLSGHRVPYTEYDLERDPKAGAKLAALGKQAGLSGDQLRGVPIIFVDGKAVKGFDKKRLGRLLGL